MYIGTVVRSTDSMSLELANKEKKSRDETDQINNQSNRLSRMDVRGYSARTTPKGATSVANPFSASDRDY